MNPRLPPRTVCRLLLTTAGLLRAAPAPGQDLPPAPGPALTAAPAVSFSYHALLTREVSAFDAGAARAARVQMMGMPSGFLVNPLGIAGDDDVPAGDAPPEPDPLSALQISFGSYNPYFAPTAPGDPSGLGYYKLYSQLQLVDQGSTSVCLGLQASTPAGQQSGGLNNGPTVVCPAVSIFQELFGGTALQGYFGQSIQANARWADNLHGNFHYGMALQCPVPGTSTCPQQGMFFFVQALGTVRDDTPRPDGSRPPPWELRPGVHWRWNSNCWMSVGVSRYNFVTWSWQF